ncbi:MAG TPA: 4-hydroxy-tetrahydrodipicolinate reductase, partial [Longimicrobiales bacterium]|nr:4-hydroxy-tetrahydrodipicolinate reductase [Longimicrobiales bacterium]
TVAAGIDQEARQGADAQKFGCSEIMTASTAGNTLSSADAAIDFSAPAGLQAVLTECADALAGKAIIVGTTGLSDELKARIAKAAERSPIIVSANYSVGVNLMLGVVASAARVLPAERFDVEIVETHHRHKADAPSGTALLLGSTVAEARQGNLADVRRDGRTGHTGERPPGEVGFHAVRGGEVVGEHRVLFLGAHERFEIGHAAADRGVFAEGALLATKWLIGKAPGLYTMRDVLGL